jgi:tripartite-type tricarboxylate transporter receptor subunit TctC
MSFDPIKDFTPITLAWETVAVVAVHPSLPVNSMRELIDYAKKYPGKLSYGTSGIGTSHHMASEMLKLTAGVDMVHVPTIKEVVPGFSGPPFWTSYYGPANLPQALVRRLNLEINKAANTPDVKAKLDGAGFLVVGTSPEELSSINKADIERAGQLVKAAGIQPE